MKIFDISFITLRYYSGESFESVLVQLYEFNHKLLAYAVGANDRASYELFSQIEWDVHYSFSGIFQKR